MSENVLPPGWYPDPRAPGQVRWWNGHAWSDDVVRLTAAAPFGHAAPPAPPPLTTPTTPRRRRALPLVGVAGAALLAVVAAATLALTLGGDDGTAGIPPSISEWRAQAQQQVCQVPIVRQPLSSTATLAYLEHLSGRVVQVPFPHQRDVQVFAFYDHLSRMAESVRRVRRTRGDASQPRIIARLRADVRRATRAGTAAGIDLTPSAALCARLVPGS